MKIRWEGQGLNEVGHWQSPSPSMGEGRGEGDKPIDKLMSPSGGGAGGGTIEAKTFLPLPPPKGDKYNALICGFI